MEIWLEEIIPTLPKPDNLVLKARPSGQRALLSHLSMQGWTRNRRGRP